MCENVILSTEYIATIKFILSKRDSCDYEFGGLCQSFGNPAIKFINTETKSPTVIMVKEAENIIITAVSKALELVFD